MSASRNLSALLIEDDSGDARLFREYLGESEQDIELTWKDKLKTGLEMIQVTA